MQTNVFTPPAPSSVPLSRNLAAAVPLADVDHSCNFAGTRPKSGLPERFINKKVSTQAGTIICNETRCLNPTTYH